MNATRVVRKIRKSFNQSLFEVVGAMLQRLILVPFETTLVTAPAPQGRRDKILAGHRATISTFPRDDRLQKRDCVLEVHRTHARYAPRAERARWMRSLSRAPEPVRLKTLAARYLSRHSGETW